MSNDNVIPISQKRYKKLENDLEYLKNVRLSEVAERLRAAREEGGDLSESAEYADAKNEEAFIQGKINQIEMQLSQARVVDDEETESGTPGEIRLYSAVTVQSEGESPETFHIVGPLDADPEDGSISNESPLGRALMGKKVGDKAVIEVPDGMFEYRIIAVE
ncbi:MAG: transcription elongation factor GreA [Anaerolineae bacterium]|nr:transcription elongation factor GreA [Anaerolineae bacterium]